MKSKAQQATSHSQREVKLNHHEIIEGKKDSTAESKREQKTKIRCFPKAAQAKGEKDMSWFKTLI
jgi:hypothetical protein